MRYSARQCSVAIVSLWTIAANAQDKIPEVPRILTAAEIVERSRQAFYYPGTDIKAKITMELITDAGAKRTRILAMLRRNDPKSQNQKYFLYFHEPADVRRMVFMVWKYPEREDDRWLFVPALDLVRRVAADDKRSSFVGSDFTYEDVSGRDVSADTHSLLREEKVGERDCYVVQSVPKTVVDYTKQLSWIDKGSFLPLKEEYYDAQEQLFRVFTADRIESTAAGEGESKGTFPTIVRRTMKNIKAGHRTEVTYTSVSYNLGLKDEHFSERSMRHPPMDYLK